MKIQTHGKCHMFQNHHFTRTTVTIIQATGFLLNIHKTGHCMEFKSNPQIHLPCNTCNYTWRLVDTICAPALPQTVLRPYTSWRECFVPIVCMFCAFGEPFWLLDIWSADIFGKLHVLHVIVFLSITKVTSIQTQQLALQ